MIPQIKKILYATDMAKKHDARIVIIHAIEPIPAYAEVYGVMMDEFKKKRHEEIIESMKKTYKNFAKKQRLK